ncbi:MAG: helix-turn-helix domain-containing protein [Gudongella sp.]|nr:helix-turn-helix domain-containing protein [Gudongella sp.]
MDISNKIIIKRQELNLTQQQVADKVFVTRQTISKWELGKSKPDLISLSLLNKVLNLSDLEDKEEKYLEGVFTMNQKLSLKDFVFALIFGVLFFPIRVLYTLNQQHKASKLIKFIIKPILIVVFLLFVGTLNLQTLIFVILTTLFLYYILNIYYSKV